jgi:hypothetical protein
MTVFTVGMYDWQAGLVNSNPATYTLNSVVRFGSWLEFSLVISLRQKPD